MNGDISRFRENINSGKLTFPGFGVVDDLGWMDKVRIRAFLNPYASAQGHEAHAVNQA
jgi:hypothetical protein